MFEIFDPTDGKPVLTVPFAFVARAVCRVADFFGRTYDYARPGEGY